MEKPFPVKLEIEAIEKNLPFYKEQVEGFNPETSENDKFVVLSFIYGSLQTLSELKATDDDEAALLNDAVPKLKKTLRNLEKRLIKVTRPKVTSIKVKPVVMQKPKMVEVVKIESLPPETLKAGAPELAKALAASRKIFGTKPWLPEAKETVSVGFTNKDFNGAPDVGPDSRGPLT